MAYDNPDGLIAAAVIVQAIVLAMVVLRLAPHGVSKGSYAASNWIILVAALLTTALAIMQAVAAANGALGAELAPQIQSQPERKDELRLVYRQYEVASVVVGLVATGLIKISVSFFYLHVFKAAPRFRNIVITWIAFMVLWTVGFLISHLALYAPYGTIANAPFINPAYAQKRCGDGIAMGRGLVISAVITDLITVLLPLPVIKSLHLSSTQAISLSVVFLVGLLSVGSSIARASIYITGSLRLSTFDYGINITALCVWNLIENQTGIIAACAPTLHPMIRGIAHSPAFTTFLRSAVNSSSEASLESKGESGRDSHSYRRDMSVGAPQSEMVQGSEDVAMPGLAHVRSVVNVPGGSA